MTNKSKGYILVSTNSLSTGLLVPDHPDILQILRETKIVQVSRDAYGLLKDKVQVEAGLPRLEIIDESMLSNDK